MRLGVLTLAGTLALVAVPAHAQDSAETLRQEIRSLRQTLDAMEKRLNAIESAPTRRPRRRSDILTCGA